MKRRDFLKSSALASTAMMVPAFVRGLAGQAPVINRTGKTLVIVQWSGGNDGLNTIVPYRNDLYYQNRPELSIPRPEVLPVSDEQGFNPALQALRALYDEGYVSVLNSVGYPNPDRSHFRSMDIWQSGSPADAIWQSGWLGRYLDSNCPGCDTPHHAIEVDDSLSLALRGEQRRGFAMSNPEKVARAARNPFLQTIAARYGQAHEDHEPAAYLYKTLIDTQSSAAYLLQQTRSYSSRVEYPQTPFARDLRQIAQLISAGTEARIYYVSLTGFDTHARQRPIQDRLLQQYAEGMKAFIEDLRQHGLLADTLILTFSEFGRRVAQNASQGTDHGTANNVLLLGGSLKKAGFYNEAADLTQLDEGDLKFRLDFRSLYATILDRWLGADPAGILKGDFGQVDVI